ncbi:transporter substrate-binding domain-containing protein [Thalassomonas sp. M1454]|uniref:transporter substrate-binding domain-containing protein n=1 Tax=Thalassomonas sp. M1454 TaxID=2594477 RepID=UPI00117CD23C|nr:transporter substrate-binding domain-containing protein [Thalassomonas sp. M1454]TRX56357.1 transporter substrate-binding domain-containing protein [Thalassomonas sp. M1454]
MRILLNLLLILILTCSIYLPTSHAQVRDLDEIKEAKVLRVLTWNGNEQYLPRAGSPPNLDKEYISRFAEQNQLQVEIIYVESFEELIPALQAGKGDVIASNLTINPLRQRQVDFTLPLLETTEYMVMGKSAKPLASAKDLANRSIAVQSGTSFALTAIGLAKVYPSLKITQIPAEMSHDEIFDKIASGEYDITINDSNILESTLVYRSDIKKSLQANSAKQVGWAVHKRNKLLKTALNNFLLLEKITINNTVSVKTNWDLIKERKNIRFVMRNNIASYYLWKGELMGFHYELARHFARANKLSYEIIVAPDNEAMFEYIRSGKADIALGFFTPTQDRIKSGLAFSRAYHYATEQLVIGTSDLNIKSVEDLKYRNITVRKSSSYWNTIKDLQTLIPEIVLTAAPEEYDTERIIAGVASGEFDLTIADNHLIDMELSLRDDILPSIYMGKEKAQSWVVKTGNTELLANVDSYIKKTYRGLFYNILHNKYFENEKLTSSHHQDFNLQKSGGALSPYDDVVDKYAKQYGFDKHLLIAQMHQESNFNPKARSYAGAQGLFQVMPRTAKELKISNMYLPENGIHAGVKYLRWVTERVERWNVQQDQVIWFALASYNAGYGHVNDARRLARQKGWRDDVWFDNVERAMLLLSQRKYSSKARYGYVRGKEPVNYVRNIRHKYEIYSHAVSVNSF